MLCGKTANREIKKIHKSALRILFSDYEASFADLLQRNNEQTTHIKILHKLMTEVYKSLNCQNPEFTWDLLLRKEITYDLRAKDLLQLPNAKTYKHTRLNSKSIHRLSNVYYYRLFSNSFHNSRQRRSPRGLLNLSSNLTSMIESFNNLASLLDLSSLYTGFNLLMMLQPSLVLKLKTSCCSTTVPDGAHG